MEYQTPELTALTNAVTAIRAGKVTNGTDSGEPNEVISGYEDWEE